MWRKIKEILCKHTAYKDESAPTTVPSTITGSMIDLKPLPATPSRRTETLHHHQHQQRRPYRKATNKSTLNKTDEHCRSLFNLLPASFRSRHPQQQTSNSKGIDASTTTQASPSNELFGTDYDSGYMSQSVLNRTSSYVSCYSAVATTTPISSMVRYGSIENLLHGHSKSNPAHVRVLVRKNFDPFAQAHMAVTKGAIVTALFSRGPWLYVRMESNGQTGYIPRIICSLHKNRAMVNEKTYHHQHQHHLSISSTDSSSNKDDELDLTIMSGSHEQHFIRPYQQEQQINRYLSQSSAMINEQQKYQEHSRKHFVRAKVDERERRNTCALPPPPPLNAPKDRRLTVNGISWPVTTKQTDAVGIHQTNDVSTSTTAIPTRDTDSSSTQDSGYSESTSYFLVQQTSPDAEQPPLLVTNSKTSTTASSPHYATVRRASQLKAPDPGNTHHYSLRRQQPSTKGSDRPHHHRHTLLNGISMTEGLSDDINKRHSFGNFYTTEQQLYDSMLSKMNPPAKVPTGVSQRPVEFALIRNVRRDHDELYQRSRPAIHNLPKSHRQIPASIFLNHHRQHQQQQQQFGSSHSAFRPVQPTIKGKRASSEGHSPSNEENAISSRVVSPSTSSLSSSSSSSVSSSLSKSKVAHLTKQRRLSCELPPPKPSKSNSSSLTRSVCDHLSTSRFNEFSRTMSEILCDQFSEINLDAIEQDSLQPSAVKRNNEEKLRNLLRSSQESFTVLKDYRSSRASFSVKRGDRVDVIKQAGRACFLVRKQTNGQIGFLPRGLMTATTKTRVDTFLETHGYRETVI